MGVKWKDNGLGWQRFRHVYHSEGWLYLVERMGPYNYEVAMHNGKQWVSLGRYRSVASCFVVAEIDSIQRQIPLYYESG